MTSAKLAAALNLHRAGRYQDAARLYGEILASDPLHADAWHLLGMTVHELGDQATAADHIRRAIAISPTFPDYHNNLATVCYARHDFSGAEANCREAIRLNAAFPQAHNNLGNALLAQGQPRAALLAYEDALRLEPRYPRALSNAAGAFQMLGEYESAIAYSHRALILDPDCVEALTNLGGAELAIGNAAAADEAFRAASVLWPKVALLWNNRAAALQHLDRWEEAIACYQQALTLDPDNATAIRKLVFALRKTGRRDQIEPLVRAALERHPQDALLHNELGELRWARQETAEALACFRRAAELPPSPAVARYNLANALRAFGQLDEAIAAYDHALSTAPDFVPAMTNLAIALVEQGRAVEALIWFERAYAATPDDARAGSHVVVCRQYLPDTTPAQLATWHADWDRRHARSLTLESPRIPASVHVSPGRALRVGFVSRDLRNHPVGFFLIGLLEARDRSRLETYCYYDNAGCDALTERIKTASDHWRQIEDLSDEQLAKQIATDGVDVLIDLAGHTAHNRLLVFARRPAPLQATWMGYVGTTGMTAMDLLISDRFHTPPGCEEHYCEQILRMPAGYICFTPPDYSPPVASLPLKQRSFPTFGCFNNPAKISDFTINLWSQILQRIPQARLILKYPGLDSEGACRHFLTRFSAEHIDSHRIILEGSSPPHELLARYSAVDVALDTFPYSGGLTTCEALWMGVPVVTFPGETFASRHSLSHLANSGFTSTIAASPEEYVDLAVTWASDVDRLAECRVRLRDQLRCSPLCDSECFARNWTSALEDVWRGKAVR